ncbi:MAG: hypothetical protein IKJ74_04290 [Clostridia bacterium]|nr:hypothetical protein [Clostridia bacterium]
MTEQEKMEQARITFTTLCQFLEKNDWHFKKNVEKLVVECGAQGDDLPMELTIRVDAERSLVMLLSRLPFAIQEDKRLDVAVAVTAINNAIVDGSFDYDVVSGNMFFRMTNSIIESRLSEEVFAYMIYASCQMVDEYNDRFLMLAKGMLTLEQFLSKIGK